MAKRLCSLRLRPAVAERLVGAIAVCGSGERRALHWRDRPPSTSGLGSSASEAWHPVWGSARRAGGSGSASSADATPCRHERRKVNQAREHAMMLLHGGSVSCSWRLTMAPHPLAHEHATCSGWLARTDPEWARAWSSFPDPVMAHPVSGECLEYLGSAQYPGRGWVQVFRHRQVPGSDQRQYWEVPASVGWQPVPPQ